jgi:pyruvate,water dikinase
MERISLELSRKDFRDMRWEELWDSSLRIRGMFLNIAMPSSLVKKLREPIEELFGDRAVAVRSSAPGEDSSVASFAGLHESFLNVRGIYAILDHIRLVWASLCPMPRCSTGRSWDSMFTTAPWRSSSRNSWSG